MSGSALAFPDLAFEESRHILFFVATRGTSARPPSAPVPAQAGPRLNAKSVLGSLFGLPAPAALALSHLKRARDIALGVPVLLAWQGAEGGRALRASRDAATLIAKE